MTRARADVNMATVLKDKATMSKTGERRRRMGERMSAEVRNMMYVLYNIICN